MSFFDVWLPGFLAIMGMMTIAWVISVVIKNASIVDLIWGFGYVLASGFYALQVEVLGPRSVLVLVLAAVWGMRLSIYLTWRNWGKPEDFRYQQFRKDYGPERYWWFSFFQVFLLQGTLMWLISLPLAGAMTGPHSPELNVLDFIGIGIWVIGFIFEAGGDYQLARFKANSANKGKLLDTGLWRYTRHPNYFGDAAVWWGFGLISIAGSAYWQAIGAVIMTALIIKVSGVALLERSLKSEKPGYAEYVRKTSAFIPWFPRK